MSDIETCRSCENATGRAGSADDSLHIEGIGPFCRTCFEYETELLMIGKERAELEAVARSIVLHWSHADENKGTHKSTMTYLRSHVGKVEEDRRVHREQMAKLQSELSSAEHARDQANAKLEEVEHEADKREAVIDTIKSLILKNGDHGHTVRLIREQFGWPGRPHE